MAYSSIWAGRFVPVFFSSHMVSGASWEYRRLSLVYASKTPRAIADSSPPLVSTCWPRLPITIAVPVSWHIGSTPAAAMFAFLSRSRATNLSFGDASGSSRMLRSWRRWAGRRKCAMSCIASLVSAVSAAGSTWRKRRPPASKAETPSLVSSRYSVSSGPSGSRSE